MMKTALKLGLLLDMAHINGLLNFSKNLFYSDNSRFVIC